jgi:hypothetical protein
MSGYRRFYTQAQLEQARLVSRIDEAKQFILDHCVREKLAHSKLNVGFGPLQATIVDTELCGLVAFVSWRIVSHTKYSSATSQKGCKFYIAATIEPA